MRSAAEFQRRTRPPRSTRKTPSPIVASTRAACAALLGLAGRGGRSRSPSWRGARAPPRASGRRRRSARPDSDETSVIAPRTPLAAPRAARTCTTEARAGAAARGAARRRRPRVEHLVGDLGHELRLAACGSPRRRRSARPGRRIALLQLARERHFARVARARPRPPRRRRRPRRRARRTSRRCRRAASSATCAASRGSRASGRARHRRRR